MSQHADIPTPSETYNARDHGTEWPPDAFTQMVMSFVDDAESSTPAANSYANDANMEALDAFPPYATNGETDIGGYTGAVGPSGRATPEDHAEVTAP